METLEAPVPRRSRRWMVVVALIVFAGVAAVFAVRTDDGTLPPAGAHPLAVTAAHSFDPQGNNHTENEDLVPNAFDQNPATAWRSEHYVDSDAMAGKDGVGLAMTLDGSHPLGKVDVRTPEAGWSAQVYVAPGKPPKDLAGWGKPLTSVQSAKAGVTRLTLPNVTGDQVLLWFTKVPPSGTAQVSEISIWSR